MKGENAGAASDIYSLGVVLYEILTGHRPYRMRSRLAHEIVRVICEEEPTQASAVVSQVEDRAVESGRTITITPQSVSRERETTPEETPPEPSRRSRQHSVEEHAEGASRAVRVRGEVKRRSAAACGGSYRFQRRAWARFTALPSGCGASNGG